MLKSRRNLISCIRVKSRCVVSLNWNQREPISRPRRLERRECRVWRGDDGRHRLSPPSRRYHPLLLLSSFGRRGAHPCQRLFDELLGKISHFICVLHRVSQPLCRTRSTPTLASAPFRQVAKDAGGEGAAPTAFTPIGHYLRPILESLKKDPQRANVSSWSPAASTARGRRPAPQVASAAPRPSRKKCRRTARFFCYCPLPAAM